jgi:hypothetical protein
MSRRAELMSAVEAHAADDEIDAFAARDRDDDGSAGTNDAAPTWPPGPGLLSTLAAEIAVEASRPWISLRVGPGAGEELEAIPVGAVAFILGAPGSGKSSLAVEIAIHHARAVGPVVFISREMKRTHTAARFASNCRGLTWADVLRGRADHDAVCQALAEFSDVAIIDRDDANLEVATRWIRGWRTRGDERPILVIADYVQILDGHDDTREERARVGQIVEGLRRWADENDVLAIGLSQMSRAAARALLSGETVGADTAAGGAESAQIERAAHVVMAIGEVVRGDGGYTDASLSIGKARLGESDRVVPVRFHGASGRYQITGAAVTGATHKATRGAARSAAKVQAAGLAVKGALADASAPMSRNDLRRATGLARADVYNAIATLIDAGELVEVATNRKGGAWPVWTAARAAAASLPIVPREST